MTCAFLLALQVPAQACNNRESTRQTSPGPHDFSRAGYSGHPSVQSLGMRVSYAAHR